MLQPYDAVFSGVRGILNVKAIVTKNVFKSLLYRNEQTQARTLLPKVAPAHVDEYNVIG